MSMAVIELLVIVLVGVPVLLLLLRPGPRAEQPDAPARLSRLCGFGFLCAFFAVALSISGIVVAEMVACSDFMGYHRQQLRDEILVAEVLRYGSLLPALGALAFATAGVGAVRESGGALRGRALGRSAVLLALVVGVVCLARA